MCAGLHTMFESGRLRKLAVLIDSSAVSYFDVPDHHGLTLLMKCSALDSGGTHLAKVLLQNGANKTRQDSQGNTALIHAVARGKLNLVKLLLAELNFDLDGCDHNGRTALHFAAGLGHVDIVKVLIENLRLMKMTVDPKDNKGFTPILYASKNGHVDVARYLHQSGASLQIRDYVYFLDAAEWLATVYDLDHEINAFTSHATMNISDKRRQVPIQPQKVEFYGLDAGGKRNNRRSLRLEKKHDANLLGVGSSRKQSVNVSGISINSAQSTCLPELDFTKKHNAFLPGIGSDDGHNVPTIETTKKCSLTTPKLGSLLGDTVREAFEFPSTNQALEPPQINIGTNPNKHKNEARWLLKLQSQQLSSSYRPPAVKPPPTPPPEVHLPQLVIPAQEPETTEKEEKTDAKGNASRRQSLTSRMSRRKSSIASSLVSSSSSLASRAALTSRVMRRMKSKLLVSSGSEESGGAISRRGSKVDKLDQ